MKLPYILYALGFGFITGGIILELKEQEKRGATWHKVTLDGQEFSSSQPSQPQPQSQPTTSE